MGRTSRCRAMASQGGILGEAHQRQTGPHLAAPRPGERRKTSIRIKPSNNEVGDQDRDVDDDGCQHPAARSSSIMPQPFGIASSRLIPSGFTMSNSRNSRNPASTDHHSTGSVSGTPQLPRDLIDHNLARIRIFVRLHTRRYRYSHEKYHHDGRDKNHVQANVASISGEHVVDNRGNRARQRRLAIGVRYATPKPVARARDAKSKKRLVMNHHSHISELSNSILCAVYPRDN